MFGCHGAAHSSTGGDAAITVHPVSPLSRDADSLIFVARCFATARRSARSLPCGGRCQPRCRVPPDREGFRKFAAGLAEAGQAASAQSKNLDAMLEISGRSLRHARCATIAIAIRTIRKTAVYREERMTRPRLQPH